MEKQNTKFEIANNFEDFKKKLRESINNGPIHKMLSSGTGEWERPWGRTGVNKSVELNSDGGFDLLCTEYTNTGSAYEQVRGFASIRFLEDKIVMSKCYNKREFYNNASSEKGDIVKEDSVVFEPTENGRTVVRGPVSLFIANDDTKLGNIFYEGVRRLMLVDGKGENNLTPTMKRQLALQSAKPKPRSIV